MTENCKKVIENKEKNFNKLKVPERLKIKCNQCKFTLKKDNTLQEQKNTKNGNSNMKLGEGKFGIVLDVRPGKELEAEELRDELRKETSDINIKTNANANANEK